MSRTKCTVEKISCSSFVTTEKKPFKFLSYAGILIWLTRTYTDGKKEKALLEITLYPGYMTDGL